MIGEVLRRHGLRRRVRGHRPHLPPAPDPLEAVRQAAMGVEGWTMQA
jgi:hypothetical protein